MASHRRRGVVAMLRRGQLVPAVPAQRRPGVDLVDGFTRVKHRVSSDDLLAGRRAGNYHALCGMRVLAGSLTDRGLRSCRECAR